MAREAFLSMNISSYSNDIVSVIKLFNNIGWAFTNNQIEYLPINDNDMFDWRCENLLIEEFFSIVSKKQQIGELVGVNLYYKNTDIGITFLARSTEEILLVLSINRKTIDQEFTDFSWYIIRIVSELKRNGCKIEHIVYEDYIG